MIGEIRIENLGVIQTADVSFGPGLTAITGETGAGKTMVLTGLALLLGRKADPGMVRSGSAQASAEGSFVLAPDSAAAERARQAGAELDDGDTLTVLRTVAAAGRSRAHLGGRTVPQAVLAELAEELVTVHGQADQVRLRSPRRQREALDAFAGPGHASLLARYRDRWARRAEVATELSELTDHAAERRQEAELLRIGLTEVERVDPQPGEDVELAVVAERLGHAEGLRAAAAMAHNAIAGSDDAVGADGAVTAVDQARRALEQVAEHDAALAELAGRLSEVEYQLTDLMTELSRYADLIQADPARLDQVNDRRAALAALTRIHGPTVDDVLAWASQAGLRLLDLDQGDERVDALHREVQALTAELTELAAELTDGRGRAASRLAEVVTDELGGLAMPTARFTVELRPTEEPGPWGAEDVVMLLSGHAGAPPVPLGHGASGGELSRVMLAIEVALATAGRSAERPGTFVFDEVDAGVGGKAAVEVGRRLAELARRTQVVVVTHLPQVAAFADQHVVVRKSADGADVITAADVAPVTGQARVAELARMLSGQEDSATALEHAAELLERSVVAR